MGAQNRPKTTSGAVLGPRGASERSPRAFWSASGRPRATPGAPWDRPGSAPGRLGSEPGNQRDAQMEAKTRVGDGCERISFLEATRAPKTIDFSSIFVSKNDAQNDRKSPSNEARFLLLFEASSLKSPQKFGQREVRTRNPPKWRFYHYTWCFVRVGHLQQNATEQPRTSGNANDDARTAMPKRCENRRNFASKSLQNRIARSDRPKRAKK